MIWFLYFPTIIVGKQHGTLQYSLVCASVSALVDSTTTNPLQLPFLGCDVQSPGHRHHLDSGAIPIVAPVILRFVCSRCALLPAVHACLLLGDLAYRGDNEMWKPSSSHRIMVGRWEGAWSCETDADPTDTELVAFNRYIE